MNPNLGLPIKKIHFQRPTLDDATTDNAMRQRPGARSVNVNQLQTSSQNQTIGRTGLGNVIGTITIENRSSNPVSVFVTSSGTEAPEGNPLFVVPSKYYKRFPLATAGATVAIIVAPVDGVAPTYITTIVDSEVLPYATGPLGPGE